MGEDYLAKKEIISPDYKISLDIGLNLSYNQGRYRTDVVLYCVFGSAPFDLFGELFQGMRPRFHSRVARWGRGGSVRLRGRGRSVPFFMTDLEVNRPGAVAEDFFASS